jgi:hypothetical protein
MSYKVQGVVKVIMDDVQVTEKFRKRELVITDTSGMYPQDIIFQATQDKCQILDAISEGENVEVSFNLRGREWTSPKGEVKYFNTLEAWRVEAVSQNDATVSQKPAKEMSDIPATAGKDDEDLPF